MVVDADESLQIFSVGSTRREQEQGLTGAGVVGLFGLLTDASLQHATALLSCLLFAFFIYTELACKSYRPSHLVSDCITSDFIHRRA